MKRLQQHVARKKRARWETAVTWFRLRYHEAAGPAKSLRLLSAAQACGRVAVCYQPGIVGGLYVGVPAAYAALLSQMAADFNFSLREQTPEAAADEPLSPAARLPWERPFVAHIVDGCLFVSGEAGGSAFPAPDGASSGDWSLPEPPPLGVGLVGAWPQTPPPPELHANPAAPERWLLGWSQAGELLAAPGCVNLYGTTAAEWLVPQLTQTIAAGHAGLVILDGVGDLAPQLKRKTAVTRLLGRSMEGLNYVDVDGATLIDGFDPLAAVPGETEEGRRARRTTWFRLMGVHKTGLALLTQAPLTDLAGLQKWLAAPAQQRQGVAAGVLEAALARLTADRQIRQWLEWPADRFAGLPQGALIFTCRGQEWARQQLLVAAFLAACAVPGVRMVLHGLPWGEGKLERELEREEEGELEREGEIGGRGEGERGRAVLVSNGPLLAGSLPALTASRPEKVLPLARRFLGGDPVLAESLSLLPPGEAVVCHETGLYHTRWTARKEGAPAIAA